VVGLDFHIPAFLGDQCATAMVTMVMADEDEINFSWVYVKSGKSLFQLCAAKALVDENFGMFGLEQSRIPATAGSEVREYHRHLNRDLLVASGL